MKFFMSISNVNVKVRAGSGLRDLASNPGFSFRILSRSFGEKSKLGFEAMQDYVAILTAFP